ncbi:MAG: cytochrome C [Nitrospinae bacterium CG11_big_fil_rev_8_21_14_0_20_56_8]|nr:MAG: cytochrome C [Nitrospinae bacterium CG11_big_fil_rev_8_21_14_0_20_56_8]
MNITKMMFGCVAACAFALATVPTASKADEGEKVFKKCKACHSVEAGKHKVGPSLHGVIGRKAGTAEGYNRYKGLKGADWTWDEASVSEYLENPSKFTKARTGHPSAMGFKLKKEDERKAVIEYLKAH